MDNRKTIPRTLPPSAGITFCLIVIAMLSFHPPSVIASHPPNASHSYLEPYDLRPPFYLPQLPYDFAALEPHIDKETMTLHYSRHHQGYTENLNSAIAKLGGGETGRRHEFFGSEPILVLLRLIAAEEHGLVGLRKDWHGDMEVREVLRNNGGGYGKYLWEVLFEDLALLESCKSDLAGHSQYSSAPSQPQPTGTVNHAIFWRSMSPNPESAPRNPQPDTPFHGALVQNFGSVTNFTSAFTAKALSLFGSGWVFLVRVPHHANSQETVKHDLRIIQTRNQDIPEFGLSLKDDRAATTEASKGSDEFQPRIQQLDIVLALDVWEHAYYLKYRNKRKNYVEAWWNVVNWDEVARRFDESVRVELAEEERRKTEEDELKKITSSEGLARDEL
ncbi:hypothetical protein HK102_013178 [Quaeritorhiza haematococci]|nr:hypothetical protein HK102_013178 [Quaeritorhiza haematococci]